MLEPSQVASSTALVVTTATPLTAAIHPHVRIDDPCAPVVASGFRPAAAGPLGGLVAGGAGAPSPSPPPPLADGKTHGTSRCPPADAFTSLTDSRYPCLRTT